MNISELRIGNYVKDDKDRIGSVHLMTMLNGVYTLHLLPYLSSNHFHKKLSQLKPIPLSEEILLKAGFFKFNNAYVLEQPTENILVFKFSIWNDFTYNSAEFPIQLESLHQLQNLYFALTGEELTINL